VKISVHTDILIELAAELQGDNQGQGPVGSLFDQQVFDFWAPALCIAKAHEAVRESGGDSVARKLLEFVQARMSSVPLRNATLSRSLADDITDLEAASHLSVDSMIGIDAVLSRKLTPPDVGGLTCASPEELAGQHSEPAAPTKVPFLDLKAQFPKIYNEIDDRISDIIANTGFILGPHVDEFEKEFARSQGVKHCIGVSSGTDALHLAMMALGIGPGDEVIVPANTFIATAEGVSLAGATPVFVDCDDYYNIDIEKTRQVLEERSASGRVRAIIPVHLYGQPADLDGLQTLAAEFGVHIVEDAAQAHLAEYKGGTIGRVGAFAAFSFYPGKNLGAYGEAGALLTNDDDLYEAAKMRRAHGEAKRYVHSAVGHNYRMAAIQGAVLATKLKHLPGWTEARQRNAALYKELLADVDDVGLPQEADFAKSAYHLFVVQVDDRDTLRTHLEQNGIASGLHYPLPLHLQEAYKDLGYTKGAFPVAEAQAERIVSLPMYPELTRAQIEYVCDTIRQFYA
jgi:dTDP-4-amino-4,6-dideoxygalactose transaminase